MTNAKINSTKSDSVAQSLVTAMDERAQTVKRYYALYQEGELENEPARLICEYFENEGDQDFDGLLAKVLTTKDFGNSGELGGVNIDEGIEGYDVRYTSDSCCTWQTFDALLDLAKIADEGGLSAPIPDWFDDSWMGIEQDLAEQMIDEMSLEDAEGLADELGICVYDDEDEDEEEKEKEYRCGFASRSPDVKEALKYYFDDETPEKRRQLLSNPPGMAW